MVSTVLPSISTPGSERASEPVASMMCVASTSVVLPSFSTVTRPGPRNLAPALIVSTLFFLKSNPMPLACFLTILSLRASIAGQFIFTSFDFESEFLGVLEVVVDLGVVQQHLGGDAADVQARAAEERILFDHGVFNPHCAARMAATYPPGPLPMITRSYLAKPVLPLRLLLRQTIRFMEGYPGLWI